MHCRAKKFCTKKRVYRNIIIRNEGSIHVLFIMNLETEAAIYMYRCKKKKWFSRSNKALDPILERRVSKELEAEMMLPFYWLAHLLIRFNPSTERIRFCNLSNLWLSGWRPWDIKSRDWPVERQSDWSPGWRSYRAAGRRSRLSFLIMPAEGASRWGRRGGPTWRMACTRWGGSGLRCDVNAISGIGFENYL